MTAAPLSFLIVSDLHAHSADPLAGDSPSYLSVDPRFSSPMLNPLTSLGGHLSKIGISANWILTPGDLADKADAVAQNFAWSQLEQIRGQVNAELLIGTAGNHDVDSRRQMPAFDPKSVLQSLHPLFPTSFSCFQDNDRVYADRYWSRNFVVLPFPRFDCQMIVINTCAFHGFASESDSSPKEHLFGRISPLTLEAIRESITGSSTRLNLVLLHHHVSRHPWLDDKDQDIEGGERLVEMLKETGRQWLIIHGHRHVPRLSYADSSPFSPVVLSSGSVAAKTYRVRGGHPRNQIHHVLLDPNDAEADGSSIRGQVQTWTWSPEVGWSAASLTDGLPHISGFGYRPSVHELRDRILSTARASGSIPTQWDAIEQIERGLKFLVPEDFSALLKLIEAGGGRLQYEYGKPTLVEVRP